MKKLTKVAVDARGHRYYYASVTFNELMLSPYAFKEERPGLVDTLIKDLEGHWILEPITVYEDDKGVLWIAGGKHRRKACEEHDHREAAATEDGKFDRWMDTPLDAKVYLDLPSKDIPGIVMALDDVRKQAAAGERQVGLAYDYRANRDALKAARKPIDEVSVLKEIGWVSTHMKFKKGQPVLPKPRVRAVIVANHIQRLVDESALLRGVVTQRQRPRKAIEEEVSKGSYPLITRENLQFLLNQIVRTDPVTAEELKAGPDPREIEFANLKVVLETLVKDVIVPLAREDVDKAVGMCRRHPIEAVGLYVQQVFTRLYSYDPTELLSRKAVKDWAKFKRSVKKLASVDWTNAVLQNIRSAPEIYKGVHTKGAPEGLRDLLD